MRRAWLLLLFAAPALARPIPLQRLAVSRHAQVDGQGFYRMPLVLGEDYTDPLAEKDRLRADLKTARSLGSPYLRLGFSWLKIETAPGRYDWAATDLIVDEAQAAGMPLIPYVSYTPEWAGATPGDPPRELADFGRFMYAIADRYRHRNPGVILSWELWNEPDVDSWKGTVGAFATMIQGAALETRRADPDAVLILGGLTLGPSGGFFWPLVHDLGITDYVDVIAYHVYPETWWPERIEQILPLWPDVMVQWLKDAAAEPDFWLNEFGYADYRYSVNQASMWSERPDIFFAYEHTAAYQAVQFLKIQLIQLATEAVTATTWYRIDDFRSASEIGGDGDGVNLHLGAIDVLGKPKPVLGAMENYGRLFGVPVRSLDSQVKVIAPPGSQAITHVFERKDGVRVIAAWLRSLTADEATKLWPPATWGMLADPRTETISVELPGLGGGLCAVDAEGNAAASGATSMVTR